MKRFLMYLMAMAIAASFGMSACTKGAMEVKEEAAPEGTPTEEMGTQAPAETEKAAPMPAETPQPEGQ